MKNFKQWITGHDPKTEWNFDNPQELKKQLVNVIRERGEIDLNSIFEAMYLNSDPGLTVKQNKKFLIEVINDEKKGT